MNTGPPLHAGTLVLVVLPLSYIRPFGSKCFAGGLLHVRGSGLEAKDLQEPPTVGMPGILDGGMADPACHSMFKTAERKDLLPAVAGLSPTITSLAVQSAPRVHQ